MTTTDTLNRLLHELDAPGRITRPSTCPECGPHRHYIHSWGRETLCLGRTAPEARRMVFRVVKELRRERDEIASASQ